MTAVVLASGSPRRHELLTRIGVPFTVRVPDIDESPDGDEPPPDYVLRLAFAKAAAVNAAAHELVVAADTTVELAGEILGKPLDEHDAASMLRRLSARTHRVHTGVAVRLGELEVAEVCTTLVTFVELDDAVASTCCDRTPDGPHQVSGQDATVCPAVSTIWAVNGTGSANAYTANSSLRPASTSSSASSTDG